LGDSTNRNTPVKVPGLTNVLQLTAGATHSLALHSDGTVSSFGYSRLGLGDSTTRNTPVKVPGLTYVLQLTAGAAHSLALHNDGTVSAFGRNNDGQ
jgi:alpha-tubulin suppressor-like RCC1 family protein